MNAAQKLLNNSIDPQLCCHCGACAGLCPAGAITVNQNTLSVSLEKCVDCGLCIHACPASGYRLSDLTCEDIKEMPKFTSCAVDKSVSANASSGGFVTQTLLTLLDNNLITAAAVVVTGESLNESSSKFIVTSSREDILLARRSKYTQATIDSVIAHVKKHDGRYAVVGLPCQLYALTKAMERLPVLKSRIIYKIGMVCGYTYDEKCIDGLLKVLGTSRGETESVLGWREGGLPGNFSVKLKNGETASIPFADEHSVDVTYFAQNRCLMCKDCLCEYGDVVCADIGGWSDKKTLVFVRNNTGRELLESVKGYGQLLVEPCSIPFEKTVLPFMLREKRSKVALRIKKNRRRCLPTTEFVGGYTPKLLLSQKIEALLSGRLQEKARKSFDKHSPKKMLRIGHQSYHRISSMLGLKVLFKLQVCFSAIIKKASGIAKSLKTKLIVNFTGKLCTCKKPLRAVIIGLGQWGSQYLTFLKCSKYFKLVSAFDFDREKLEGYGKKFGFKPAGSVESLCKDNNAQVVFVLTPTPTHADVFCEVSKYGLPVYMEKPIAANLAGSREILKLANESNALVYVAHSMKYEPSIKKTKELLQSGALGEISDIRIVRTVKSKHTDYYPNAALYQIGVHLIDVLYYLLGYTDGVAVFQKDVDGNIETVSYKQGSTNVSLRYGFGGCYNFSLSVFCEKGCILLSNGELKVIVNSKEKTYKIPMKNEKTIYSQLKEFYYAATKKEDFLNTKENAEKIMEFCDQIIKAGE